MTATEMAIAARAEGFTGDGLVIIVAISGAEAGYEDETDNTARPNSPGYRALTPEEIALGWLPEYSVGPLMIDLEIHTEITEADARTFDGAARWAYGASQQGTVFTAWSTYTGAGMPAGSQPPYLAHMDEARAAVAATEPPQPAQDGDLGMLSPLSQGDAIKLIDAVNNSAGAWVTDSGTPGAFEVIGSFDGKPIPAGVRFFAIGVPTSTANLPAS